MSAANRPGWVFFVSLALLTLFVVTGAMYPLELARAATIALEFTQAHFGWFYLFATTAFLVFCVGIAFSSYGGIRLGADGEAPEFAYPAWLGMIFSAGMGVGLVFWSVAEPMAHYVEPPLGLAAPRSADSARLAMRYSLFHWGFHQWANFAVVGLAIAYVSFRRGAPGLISETFREALGAGVDRSPGHAINVLAVLSTVFGVATTLGLGIIQINSGLAAVSEIGPDPAALDPRCGRRRFSGLRADAARERHSLRQQCQHVAGRRHPRFRLLRRAHRLRDLGGDQCHRRIRR